MSDEALRVQQMINAMHVKTGHCGHCLLSCPYGYGAARHASHHAAWTDGNCPYCAGAKAERARVVAYLTEQAHDYGSREWFETVLLERMADDIEEAQHVRGDA